jgi:hypothetical protein
MYAAITIATTIRKRWGISIDSAGGDIDGT